MSKAETTMSAAEARVPVTYTYAEWKAEGERRFGPSTLDWQFACPSCGVVTRAAEWLAATAPSGAPAFSCIGRYAGPVRDAFGPGPGPCNYAGGGLIGINPVTVTLPDGKAHHTFAFALAEEGGAR